MDQFISEIEAYAVARGIEPTTVIQYAANASGVTWLRWKSGGGCSVRTMDRVRAYMAANPPEPSPNPIHESLHETSPDDAA